MRVTQAVPVREEEQAATKALDNYFKLHLEPPNLCERTKWEAPAIEEVLWNSLVSPASHADFRKYLVTKLCEENLDFITIFLQLKEVKEKRKLGMLELVTLVNHIAEVYIYESASKQINIKHDRLSEFTEALKRLRTQIDEANLMSPSPAARSKAGSMLSLSSRFSISLSTMSRPSFIGLPDGHSAAKALAQEEANKFGDELLTILAPCVADVTKLLQQPFRFWVEEMERNNSPMERRTLAALGIAWFVLVTVAAFLITFLLPDQSRFYKCALVVPSFLAFSSLESGRIGI